MLQEAKFRLSMGLHGLFFKPNRQCMTTDPKDAFDASHTRAFVISSYDLLFLFLGIAATWLENTSFATILTPKLLTPARIVTVLDNVCAAAAATHMDDCFCYHMLTIPSLQFDHHLLFLG